MDRRLAAVVLLSMVSLRIQEPASPAYLSFAGSERAHANYSATEEITPDITPFSTFLKSSQAFSERKERA